MQSLKGTEGPGGVPKKPLLSELNCEENPRNRREIEGISTITEFQEIESKSTKWTDEKHSLYLESMEASFVDQLYNSLEMDFHSHEEYTSEPKYSSQKHTGKTTPSGQFKVFQDGSWGKINFGRETPRRKQANGSGNLFENPWVQHYSSSCRHESRISPTCQGKIPPATTVHQFPTFCFQFNHRDSVGSDGEVTDQNFVDEVLKEEKSGRIRRIKSRKVSKEAGSGTDQVVPFETLSRVEDVTEGHGSSKE